MLIHGSRRKFKDTGPWLDLRCPACQQRTAWRLLEGLRWFTIYFIPIVPYARERALVCSQCGFGFQLTGFGSRSAASIRDVTRAVSAGTSTSFDLREAVRTTGLFRADGTMDPRAVWHPRRIGPVVFLGIIGAVVGLFLGLVLAGSIPGLAIPARGAMPTATLLFIVSMGLVTALAFALAGRELVKRRAVPPAQPVPRLED
jgi:hypothetical protein